MLYEINFIHEAGEHELFFAYQCKIAAHVWIILPVNGGRIRCNRGREIGF